MRIVQDTSTTIIIRVVVAVSIAVVITAVRMIRLTLENSSYCRVGLTHNRRLQLLELLKGAQMGDGQGIEDSVDIDIAATVSHCDNRIFLTEQHGSQ